MEKELEKVKKRTEKQLEQYRSRDDDSTAYNDAMDHLGRIEGYPTKNLSKVNMKKLPAPIRIFGYLAIGTMALTFVLIIVLSIWNWVIDFLERQGFFF
ncbi:hypothetical protein [Alkalihalobacillus sp. TS-13]|uniref:hypothetical protein n=1 Tax=Alkalihalobacillus sp. TS-13 TaxID=2842455 RepID=UPI0021AA6779|nr:hypothetical protein [Alkalihalobacillus sp. TS-13]